MAAATRLYRARVGADLAHIGIHAGQEGVLKALSRKDGQSMTELAASLSVQPPTVTKMVGRLGVSGYVERKASDRDGRLAHVFLTPLGQDAIHEIDTALDRIEQDALSGIGGKSQKQLLRMLRRIARNLSDADTPDDTLS